MYLSWSQICFPFLDKIYPRDEISFIWFVALIKVLLSKINSFLLFYLFTCLDKSAVIKKRRNWFLCLIKTSIEQRVDVNCNWFLPLINSVSIQFISLIKNPFAKNANKTRFRRKSVTFWWLGWSCLFILFDIFFSCSLGETYYQGAKQKHLHEWVSKDSLTGDLRRMK